MKFIDYKSNWKFVTEPFPQLRVNLEFGRHKRNSKFIPIKGDIIKTVFEVSSNLFKDQRIFDDYESALVYATKTLNEYISSYPHCWTAPAKDFITKRTLLIDDTFQVIKTKDKGTILIVPGEDKTDRVLFLVGITGQHRGNAFVSDDSTGTILAECQAENACDSAAEVAVILEKNQNVVMVGAGRKSMNYTVHIYKGNGEITTKYYNHPEYLHSKESNDISDAEVL